MFPWKIVFVVFVTVLAGVVASPVGITRSLGQTDDTLTQPIILYGPINKQADNNYQAAGLDQASSKALAAGMPAVYGPITSQHDNEYLTIGRAGQVFLLASSFNQLMDYQPDSVSELIIAQNGDTEVLFLNPKDPKVKSMRELINGFHTYQENFNRLLHLGSSCLIDKEKTPLLRRKARSNFTRQTKETKWLKEVVAHRMKLIKLHKLLWSMYSQLKLKLEVTPESFEIVNKKVNGLAAAEAKFRLKTQDFIVYVLSHIL